MNSSWKIASLLTLLCLLGCSSGDIGKRSPAQELNQSFNQIMDPLYHQFKEDPVLFKDPFLSTFWGAVADYRYYLGSKKSKLLPVKLKNPFFGTKVHAYTHLQKKNLH